MTGMYLEHYGVLGMKWGVRRYQNVDGTLTTAGKKRSQMQATMANKYAWKSVKYNTQAEQRMAKAYAKSNNPSLLKSLLSVRDRETANVYQARAQQWIDKMYPHMRDISWSSVEKQKLYTDALNWKTPEWAKKVKT